MVNFDLTQLFLGGSRHLEYLCGYVSNIFYKPEKYVYSHDNLTNP